MSSDSEDEEQWCQQPAENEEEDEEELCSEDEQEAEVNLSDDEYAKTIAALHWIAAAAFRHQHGTRQEEGAGATGEAGKAAAAERAPKRQRFTKAASRVCSNCGWNPAPGKQQSTEKLPIRDFRCTSKGRVLTLKCRKCNKDLTPVITQGTCLFMDWPDRSSLVATVRGIAKDGTLHIQHLSSRLRLPGACRYDIIRDSSSNAPDIFLLTRRHSDLPAAEFAAAWARGEAGLLGPCKLFFQPVDLFDVLAVREDGCPGFGCCASRGCACLNPWAAHGGSPYHSMCQHAPDPAEPKADGTGGCSLQGVTYAPGDLAWLLPKHARWSGGQPVVADAQLELVRIVSLGYPGPPDSQESQLPLSAIAQDLMLRYERYELSSSVDGFCYSPTGELQQCGAKWLRGLADLEHRAPGSRVLSGGGSGGGEGLRGTPGSEGAGGSGSGAAVATELPSAAGGAADGGGAASRQRTPSGSDCSANPSWCSDEGEVSSGDDCDSDACSGAASPSTGGGGGRRPSQTGQQQQHQHQQQGPWPVEICDLFCGAGGLSLGLLMSLGPRAKVKWAVDLFKEALDTYRQCHPGSRTFLEDVRSVLAGSRAGRKGYPPIGCPTGTWRMLVGGPPCQGFSKANKGSAEEKARKNVLVALFISVLFTLRWPLSIMENVNGLLSAGDTMQRIIQAAVSAGYQVRWRLLNAGCYSLAEHRRRLIVQLVRHDVPAPSFPLPYTLFPGAGGYQEPPGQPCLLQDRLTRAYSGVPRVWRAHVVVPDAAPLPALTARDVLDDLPREAAAPDALAHYDREPRCHYAARMRGRGIGGGSSSGSGGGGSRDSGSSGSASGRDARSSGGSSHGAAVDLSAVGAPLRNHCTLGLAEDTLARIRLIPKEGQPPPPGRSRWEGECSVPAHPFQPPRAGNFLDLPADVLQSRMPHLAENRSKFKLWGIYARLKWCSHFATLTTSPSLYSDTTSTILHPEADRPLTVRESARVQGFPDWVEFSGNPAQAYKQVGNAVPPPLAEALGRELARAFAEAEAQWQQQQQQQPQRQRQRR